MDEDANVKCFAISAKTQKGTELHTGIGGTMEGMLKFTIRVIRAVAEAMHTEPRMLAGAVAMILETAGEEKKIVVDVGTVTAMKEATDDDDQ